MNEPNPVTEEARRAMRRCSAHLSAAADCQQTAFNLLSQAAPMVPSASEETRGARLKIGRALEQLLIAEERLGRRPQDAQASAVRHADVRPGVDPLATLRTLTHGASVTLRTSSNLVRDCFNVLGLRQHEQPPTSQVKSMLSDARRQIEAAQAKVGDAEILFTAILQAPPEIEEAPPAPTKHKPKARARAAHKAGVVPITTN